MVECHEVFNCALFWCVAPVLKRVCMSNELKERLQALYIDLNRKFIAEVENGSDWDDLAPLMEQMKEISAELNTIPTAIVRQFNSQSSDENQKQQQG